MSTRHLVDPEIAPVLDVFPPIILSHDQLNAVRTMLNDMNAQMAASAPPFPDISVTEQIIPGPSGAPDVRVICYTPKNQNQPMPAILWIHGGGYVLGNADQDDLTVKMLVTGVGCMAVSVDYRLAPEAPFPGPVEDCYAALTWLYHNASALGVDPQRIAIGGASAGGGLAACLGLLTRDRAEIPLAYQLLIYPMLDDRTATNRDGHPYVGEFIWTREANYFGWSSLLGQEPGSENVSPYAAAARADNLAGLPPTYICVGALDLFLEEDLEYARRLMREAVATELHVYPGAYHAFNLTPQARVTEAYIRDMYNALRRALHG